MPAFQQEMQAFFYRHFFSRCKIYVFGQKNTSKVTALYGSSVSFRGVSGKIFRLVSGFAVWKSLCRGGGLQDLFQSLHQAVIILGKHKTESEVMVIQSRKVGTIPNHQSLADAVLKNLMGGNPLL